MRERRNEAVHESTLGRRLARDCVRVSIMVEDALRREAEMRSVSDSMVETVVYARLWQTLRTIRRTMMENDCTHLPLENDGQWYTVDAEALCVYRDQHTVTTTTRFGAGRCDLQWRERTSLSTCGRRYL